MNVAMMEAFCSPQLNKYDPIQVYINVAMVEAFCSSQLNDCVSGELNFFYIFFCVPFSKKNMLLIEFHQINFQLIITNLVLSLCTVLLVTTLRT